MRLGISWSRHDTNTATITSLVGAIQRTPNVCSRIGFLGCPTFAFRVLDRFANMLVLVVGHVDPPLLGGVA